MQGFTFWYDNIGLWLGKPSPGQKPVRAVYSCNNWFDTLKGIGKTSFSFNFISPYIHIYFAVFFTKTAFSREQSGVVFLEDCTRKTAVIL